MIALTAKVKVQGKNDHYSTSNYSMGDGVVQSEVSFVPDVRGLYSDSTPRLQFNVTLSQAAADKFKLGKSFTVIFVGDDDE